MDKTRQDILLIAGLGLVFMVIPVFFQRLHSDEVIFWEVAKNLASGRGAVSETHEGSFFILHMPLPFLVSALFLKISPHIFVSRAVAALFTIGTAIFIYLASSKRCDREESIAGALLFLFSFQMLRYGGRFYLDQFGTLFFASSMYFIFSRRYVSAGISAVLCLLSREYWLAVYPFLALYILRGNDGWKGFLRFTFAGAATSIVIMLAVVSTDAGREIASQMYRSAVAKNVMASLTGHDTSEAVLKLSRAWTEFLILNIIVATGALVSAFKDRSMLILILPQVLLLSLAHGFMVDGGVTQYPIGLLATLAIFSGPGMKRLFKRVFSDRIFMKAAVIAVAVQFAAFNAMATAVSLHGNISVYGFGYKDDRKVIEILKERAHGGYIHGIWGAFIDDRKRWDWTDYLVQEAIDKDPDWFVSYDNYVEISSSKDVITSCNIYRIGPYIMIQSLDGEPLGRFVRQKGFKRWALRKG